MTTPKTKQVVTLALIGTAVVTGLAITAIPGRTNQPTETSEGPDKYRAAAEEYLAAAMHLRESGHQRRAMRLLYSAIRIDPELPRLRYQIGRCHERVDERKLALPHYLAEWKAHRYDRALFEAGEILVDQGRTEELSELMAQAGPKDLRRTEQYCYLRGALAETKGKRNVALAAYREALRHDGEYERAQVALDRLGTKR